MTNDNISERSLRKIFKKTLKFKEITFWDLYDRSWKVFKNYGELYRFDVFNIMMAAAYNFSRERLETTIIALEQHHKAVMSSLEKERFHDEITASDIMHAANAYSTQAMLAGLMRGLNINNMHPQIVDTHRSIRPGRETELNLPPQ